MSTTFALWYQPYKKFFLNQVAAVHKMFEELRTVSHKVANRHCSQKGLPAVRLKIPSKEQVKVEIGHYPAAEDLGIMQEHNHPVDKHFSIPHSESDLYILALAIRFVCSP